MRRAAPLPNSVRLSAAIFSGADIMFSVRRWGFEGLGPETTNAALRIGGAAQGCGPAQSITES
jgi:hypothetical protein